MPRASIILRVGVALIGAAVTLLGSGCSDPSVIYVSLTGFAKTSTSKASLPANPNLKLFIEVNDTRQDSLKIGENREDDELGVRVVKSSGASPAEFIKEVLSREFEPTGLTIVTDRAQANRILSLSLTRFFVMETSTYEAEVAVTGNVLDLSGRKLWVRNVKGENSTFGKSTNPENYQQVLSAATSQMAGNMLADAEFAKALQVP